MDDNGLHRPPVLLQSADDQDHHYYSDRFGQQRHLSQPHVGLSHPSGDDMPFPSHVHTKDCRDVCPDQDLYTETSFIRFNKGMRTNIYGLAVVEELCSKEGLNTSSILDNEDSRSRQQQNQQRSQIHHRTETLKGTSISNTSTTTNDGSSSSESASATTVSSQSKTMFADRIGRYVLVASSGLVTCYMGMDRSSEISLGPNQEVVSIDAYESACQSGFRVVMSIAIARAEETGTQFEILFYGARTCAKSVIDHILSFPYTNDIQRIPINWAPTKILHVPIAMDLSKTAILVGGGDTKVHSFIKGHDGNIAEEPIEDYFPVLTTFHHSHNCILSMDVRDYPAFRVIAAGTQNGTLNVAIIPRNRATNELQHAEARNHSIILFSPITSLAIFTSRVLAYNSQGKRMRHGRVDGTISEKGNVDNGPGINEDVSEEEEEDVHLLMTCAIEQAWVYTAINRNGLTKRSELAACGNHDSILASYVMDIDWDGENELVIGTYGRQLMVFKQVHGYFVHQASVSSDATLRYELYWNRRFAYPVYGISSADMNNDGLEELVVTTMYGISFFQADTTAAKRRLARAINKMAEIERIRLRLERLRAENLQLESEAEAQILRIQAAEQEEDSTEEADEQEKVDKEEKELEVPDECAIEGNRSEKGVSSVTGNEAHELTSEAEQSKDTFALESADSDNKANNHLGDQQSQEAMLAPSSQGEAADTAVESSLSPACSRENSGIQDESNTDENTKFNPGDLSDISKSKSELGYAQKHE